MKKILSIILLVVAIKTNAQVVFEHDYDNASNFASGTPAVSSQLMMINFEISGERYVKIDKWTKVISVYNLNHVLVNSISLTFFPTSITTGALGDVLYLSETLFDNDNGIEFMYATDAGSANYARVYIYDHDGSTIFSDSAAPLAKINVPQIQCPIYNTSQGTKMMLSYKNRHAKVFGLPGILTNNIAQANNLLIEQSGLSNAYPNPTANTTQIDYMLPNGANQGEIVLFDLKGIEVKRFKVDRTFNTLLVSVADIPAGTYYYQLQTAGNTSEGKKIVVIK